MQILSKILPPVTVGPVKRALWIIGLALAALLIVEVLLLLVLRSQVGMYSNYWDKLNVEQSKFRGDQQELIYVALGDSAAQGIGATSPMRGYVGLVAKHLEQKTGSYVKIINLSKSGAVITEAINDQLPELAKYKPDVITVEIGANNIKDFEPATFRREFKQLIDGLPDGAYVADIPDFGTGPLVNKAEAASKIVRDELSKQPRLNSVPLEAETKENFNHWLHYAPDFFHPNNWGYKVWAKAFTDTIGL
ncbi:TPA: SGNH/GDSL hydrolase family protein [Candidatus Saccharibacteria bacterium]|nr:SGNH/GDSL hydrolase family protein [Candidatus Saccharibacteria bacterium]HIO87494.1 SGNH/GDSL hydrolase family protein [Candidatus Saccharibacteria bacterium]